MTYGITYKNNFGFNILPLRGKRPTIEWDKWQNERQNAEDIKNMEWSNPTGLGVVMGVNDIRNFDIDGIVDYELLEGLLVDLGLPEKYNWVVQSGSGEGFHIYFRCKATQNGKEIMEGDKAVYKYYMKKDGYCNHIELRWKDCQTALPPSMHESGGIYTYYYNEPTTLPEYVDIEKVKKCLGKYCEVERKTSDPPRRAGVRRENNNNKVYYDRERLESALNFLSEHLSEGSYEEWYKIGFALVPLGETGERYFINMSLKNKKYADAEDKIREKFKSLIKDYDCRVTIGSIYYIAELYGWKKPVIRFWYREQSGKLKIDPMIYKRFLESEGFCKFKLESNYFFVRIKNNIVTEIELIDVKEFVMGYLREINIEEFEDTSRNEVNNVVINSTNKLFTMQFLEFLITKNIEFNIDKRDAGYFYFRNGFVEVTKSEINFYKYKKLDKHIWDKQIIDRDYKTTTDKTDYENLMFNICRGDIKRFEALKSSVGYLLHNYKNPSIAKAIIYIDEKLSEGAFGRSGKGLIIKGIQQMRNIVVEDGRNFNPSKNFAFQRVKADTDIIAIEDISKKFPFDKLFAIITDGITIERKNKDEIFLCFKDSPKIVVSTNYSIKGVDDSTTDRQFIVEFSDFYNKGHRPINDFGKLFFESWDNQEWLAFDCFMIKCMQFYIQRGLVLYSYVNIDKKKLIDETCDEFAEFMDRIEYSKEYDKKELHEEFKSEYTDFENLKQNSFTRWIKIYCRIYGLNITEGKSGTKRHIIIKKTRNEAA